MDLKGKVIHTPTQGIYDAVVELSVEQGYVRMDSFNWGVYNDQTCLRFGIAGTFDRGYCNRRFFDEEGFTISPFKPLNIRWI